MLFPEFIPSRFQTPEMQAAIARQVARAKASGLREDWQPIIDIAQQVGKEAVANYEATPREAADRIIASYLADWHERYGVAYDAFSEGDDSVASEVKLDEDLLAFPVPDVFAVEGFPSPLSGNGAEAWGTFNKTFRRLARDAWKAREGSAADSADKQ